MIKSLLTGIAATAMILAAATAGYCASAAEGATLYAADCQMCHGALATSQKKGATPTRIQNAINSNMGGMGYLSTLTADQVLSISIALGGAPAPTPTPTPTPTPYTYAHTYSYSHSYTDPDSDPNAYTNPDSYANSYPRRD